MTCSFRKNEPPKIRQVFAKNLAGICILFVVFYGFFPMNLANAQNQRARRAPAQEAPPQEASQPAQNPQGAPQPKSGAPTPQDPNGQAPPAQGGGTPPATDQASGPPAVDTAAPPTKPEKVEEEDFAATPFTNYAEFNENEDEETDSKFFQYGRFFGVSLGLGAQFVDGNRGALWQGGFPMVDFKLHYWFDFQLALDIGLYTAQQFYDTTVKSLGHVDINMVHVGIDIKYYFQTKNLGSAISFANPYILGGVGSYSKTENSQAQGTQDADTSLGVTLGVGLEFVISPRKTYFEVEAKGHSAIFKDTYTTSFTSVQLPNLTGTFFTLSGSFLLTW